MHKLYKCVSLGFLSMLIGLHWAVAQDVDREIRGAWIASVYNINWPSSSGNPTSQKAELSTLFDSLQSVKANAAFLQVRPTCDALYNSKLAPWSEWVSGQRGVNPGYDPLEYAVSEAHRRGLELHVWLNPYRFETNAGRYQGKEGPVISDHPEWIMTVNDKTYINPGIPEVQKYLGAIAAEIVENYDIDGLCFDDYFYPTGIVSEDDAAYSEYALNSEKIGDFRRRSINEMIQTVHDTIKAIKPWVRFGVSPAGIYSMDDSAASSHGTSLPSGIVGQDNYNVIYCDPLAWLEAGSVDYISPQLYWKIGGGQDFITLSEWWINEANKHKRDCFPSIATYRLPDNGNDQIWNNDEIKNQIDELRDNQPADHKGYINYSISDIIRVNGLSSTLADEVNKILSLWPGLPGDNLDVPESVTDITFSQSSENPIALMQWAAKDLDRYLIRFLDENKNVTTESVVYNDDIYLPFDTISSRVEILSVSRYGVVNKNSLINNLPLVGSCTILNEEPESYSVADTLMWSFGPGASCYEVIYSKNANFSGAKSSGLIRQNFIPFDLLNLSGEDPFYFKVLAHNGRSSAASAVVQLSFNSLSSPTFISPISGEEFVSLTPTLEWQEVADSESYALELSTDSSFVNGVMTLTTSTASIEIDEALDKWTVYFARVRAEKVGDYSPWSETLSFKTTTDIPASPIFTNPVNNATLKDSLVSIEWGKVDFADQYRLIISEIPDLSTSLIDTILSSYTRLFDFVMADSTSYYTAVCGIYIGGEGPWSDTLHFEMNRSSIRSFSESGIKLFPNPVKRYFFIQIPDKLEFDSSVFTLYDVKARVVQTYSFKGHQKRFKIDRRDLSAGLYFIELSLPDTKEKFIQKVIISD